jgi:hypothetical protein
MRRLFARAPALLVVPAFAAIVLAHAAACDPPPDTFDEAGTFDARSTVDVIVGSSDATTVGVGDATDPLCVGVQCPAGLTCCTGGCTNVAVNTSSCGGCGIQCPASESTAGSTCVAGVCKTLAPVAPWDADYADFLVLSGSVLYSATFAQTGGGTGDGGTDGGTDAGPTCETALEWMDLTKDGTSPKTTLVTPTLAPVPDGRGGVYSFEGCPAPLLSHFTPPATSGIVLENEGVTSQPHVLVRQGDSVARITTPDSGTIRVACANGVTHDIARGGGVAFAAADDTAVYFGVGSDVTPAFKIPCDDPASPVTSLMNVYGYVAYVDAKDVYWFGTPPSEDAAAKIDSFYASSKDGTGAPRFILAPPPTIDLVSFPLLDGDLLYFVYRTRADMFDSNGTNVLARTSISKPARQDLLASASPIALDPAFAYMIDRAETESRYYVYRLPLR